MKKRLTALILFCTLCATGCASQQEQTVSNQNEFVSEVLLNSFEDYYDCYDFHAGEKYRIDFVQDENAVTDGKNAIKLTPDETYEGTQVTIAMGVPLYDLNETENDYTDFSNLQSITYDVYNGGESAISIITTPMRKVGGFSYAGNQVTTLEAKEKAMITYTVNHYNIFYSLGIDGTTHVNVQVKGTDMQVYVDNMRLHYTKKTFVEPDFKIDENEIIGFEKAYQEFAISTLGDIWKTDVVADSRGASEGNRYLRMYRDGYADGVASYGGRLVLPSNYLGNIGFENIKGEAYIAYDYKTSWVSGTLLWASPRFVSSEGGAYANIKGGSMVSDGEWHTFYCPLEFAPSYFDVMEILLSGASYGDVYFDNFRIERTIPEGTESVYIASGYTI